MPEETKVLGISDRMYTRSLHLLGLPLDTGRPVPKIISSFIIKAGGGEADPNPSTAPRWEDEGPPIFFYLEVKHVVRSFESHKDASCTWRCS